MSTTKRSPVTELDLVDGTRIFVEGDPAPVLARIAHAQRNDLNQVEIGGRRRSVDTFAGFRVRRQPSPSQSKGTR